MGINLRSAATGWFPALLAKRAHERRTACAQNAPLTQNHHPYDIEMCVHVGCRCFVEACLRRWSSFGEARGFERTLVKAPFDDLQLSLPEQWHICKHTNLFILRFLQAGLRDLAV